MNEYDSESAGKILVRRNTRWRIVLLLLSILCLALSLALGVLSSPSAK